MVVYRHSTRLAPWFQWVRLQLSKAPMPPGAADPPDCCSRFNMTRRIRTGQQESYRLTVTIAWFHRFYPFSAIMENYWLYIYGEWDYNSHQVLSNYLFLWVGLLDTGAPKAPACSEQTSICKKSFFFLLQFFLQICCWVTPGAWVLEKGGKLYSIKQWLRYRGSRDFWDWWWSFKHLKLISPMPSIEVTNVFFSHRGTG